MPLYETVFVVRQDVAQTQVEALGNQFSDLIAGMGGQVPKKEYWGLRQLAFRMKKNRKAHYMLMNIDSPAAAVKEMERTMSINEDILRWRRDSRSEGAWVAALSPTGTAALHRSQ